MALGPKKLTPAEREMIYNAYRDKQRRWMTATIRVHSRVGGLTI
jgi:hypothetical protein